MSFSKEISPSSSTNPGVLRSQTTTYHKQFHLGRILKAISILSIVLGILGLTLALVLGGGILGPWAIISISLLSIGGVLLVPSAIFLRTFVDKRNLREVALHSQSRQIATDFIESSQDKVDVQEFFNNIDRNPNSSDSEEFIKQLSHSLFLLSDLGVFSSYRDNNGILNVPSVLLFLDSLSAIEAMQLLVSPEFVKAFVISVDSINYQPLTSILLAKISSLTEQVKKELGLDLLGDRIRDAYGPLIVGDNHLLEILLSCNTDLNVRIGPLGAVWDYIIGSRNINLLKKFLLNSKYLDNCDFNGNTVLSSLIEKGKWDLIPFVLRNGGSQVLNRTNRLKIDILELLLQHAQLFPEDEGQIVNTILDLHHFENENHLLNKKGLLKLSEEEGLSAAVKQALVDIGCKD